MRFFTLLDQSQRRSFNFFGSYRVIGRLTVIITFLLCLAMSGCGIRGRLDSIAALENTRKIRTAQFVFHNSDERRFGSLTELAEAGLISEDLADGLDSRYEYKLISTSDKYSLSVSPVSDSRNWSLYLDQTGIIRGNTDEPATSNDEPIRMQHSEKELN